MSGDAGSAVAEGGAWVGDRFAHEALLFGDDGVLLERCVPFAREAVASGQPVLLMASERTRAVLRAGLGADSKHLEVLGNAEQRWLGGHETLLAYARDFRGVARSGVPWRLIAEPVWLARPEGQEWHRFESACNHLLESVPYYSLCLHDRRRLGGDVLSMVRRTHPLICDEQGLHHSHDFVEPRVLVPSLEPRWSPVPGDARHVEVAAAREGRVFAAVMAERAGLEGRRGEVELAVGELVANSLALCGTATVDSWRDGSHLVVQVGDRGRSPVDPLAGYCLPAAVRESGRGLWLARALADDATLRSGPCGTSVRLLFALPSGA